MTDLPKLAAPASRALASVGIGSLEDLARRKETDIAELHGMGAKALAVLKAEMAAHQLTFS